MAEIRLQGTTIIAGIARGIVLAANEPLSFWGGYDWKTGEIIDRHHRLSGQIAAGKILAIPFTRGSSTTTAVLLESIRAKTAPAAIITTDTDFFFALASVVADELYHSPLPLLALNPDDFDQLNTDDEAHITGDGHVILLR